MIEFKKELITPSIAKDKKIKKFFILKKQVLNKGTRYEVNRTTRHFVLNSVVCRFLGHKWAEHVGNAIMDVSRCGRCNKWSQNMNTMKEHNGLIPPLIGKIKWIYKSAVSFYMQKIRKDDLPF